MLAMVTSISERTSSRALVSILAAGGQSPALKTADCHRLRSQGEGLAHIGAVGEPAVDGAIDSIPERRDDRRQGLDRAQSPVAHSPRGFEHVDDSGPAAHPDPSILGVMTPLAIMRSPEFPAISCPRCSSRLATAARELFGSAAMAGAMVPSKKPRARRCPT